MLKHILHQPAEAVIVELDRLGRRRALRRAESMVLDRALKQSRLDPTRPIAWRWQRDEDKLIFRLRAAGRSCKVIAKAINRSEDAVAARLRYLQQKRTGHPTTLVRVSSVERAG